MLRWLFLFLVLINALVLFWYSLSQNEAAGLTATAKPVEAIKAKKDALHFQQLKLLSEVDESLLQSRSKDRQVTQITSECIYFTGFESEISAQAVVKFVAEQGYSAQFVTDIVTTIDSYYLTVSVPVDLIPRLSLLTVLEDMGSPVTEDDLVAGGSIKVVEGATKSQAEKAMTHIKQRGHSAKLQTVERSTPRYTVVVKEEFGRKLSKEIKEVVQESYSFSKIEKKVCTGVASH